jgi:hypothetical protein
MVGKSSLWERLLRALCGSFGLDARACYEKDLLEIRGSWAVSRVYRMMRDEAKHLGCLIDFCIATQSLLNPLLVPRRSL